MLVQPVFEVVVKENNTKYPARVNRENNNGGE
jgi:hypothetical protein